MKAASNTNGGAFEMGKAKIPEPKSFGGARDAREVDNFIFDMELYFTATKNDSDAGQLKMAPMYLANDAKLWWRTKVEQSISGQCSIITWDDFKKALKAQFYLENVAYNARCKLADCSTQALSENMALVDTGATDNFVADTLVTRFKITVQADAGKIKAVNSQALNTVGVARGVSYQMGPWNGKIDFTVTPLDDFDVVIGMEFLKRARAIHSSCRLYLINGRQAMYHSHKF
ncbi:hypothetical protein GH714_009610 [Hevea brasiliensis]|uniref:Retrotransposon gag domain-containing protein n=1 Tax=Hevea brasiliensis TaxID=3981 RepID=A0A6A6L246_HEVBR|nr:hypothetical protein GH714_009610 [Hevea brasiliensis]